MDSKPSILSLYIRVDDDDLEGTFTGRTFTSMTIPSLWVFVLTSTIAVIMYGFDHILDFRFIYLVFVTIFIKHIIISYGSVITGDRTKDAVVLDTVALEAVILVVVVVVALLNEILNHHVHICRGVQFVTIQIHHLLQNHHR
jgi:hypothetical protein